jgi:hypothetical protein
MSDNNDAPSKKNAPIKSKASPSKLKTPRSKSKPAESVKKSDKKNRSSRSLLQKKNIRDGEGIFSRWDGIMDDKEKEVVNMEKSKTYKSIKTEVSKKNYIRCFFEEKFDKPKKKYCIVSFSIFYSPQYIRHFYKKDSENIAIRKQLQFLYNLTLNIILLDQGYFPQNWYIRIYYDKSLFTFAYRGKKLWEEFFSIHAKNPRLQFVEFRCPVFFTEGSYHLNLFGTIARLYPIFQKEDKNLELIMVFDADNMITSDYVKEIEKFKESEFDYNTFCSRFEVSFYKHERHSSCYLRTGMFCTKVKLDPYMWDFILYQVKVFSDKKFTDTLEKLQKKWHALLPDKQSQSYRDFEYGMDEIILNYYIRVMFGLKQYKLRKVRIRPKTSAIFSIMTTYLFYDYQKDEYKYVVDQILKAFLGKDFKKEKIKENLEELMKRVRDKINDNSSFEDVYPFIKPIRENMGDFKKLWMSETIVFFFEHVNQADYQTKKYDHFFHTSNLPRYLQPGAFPNKKKIRPRLKKK